MLCTLIWLCLSFILSLDRKPIIVLVNGFEILRPGKSFELLLASHLLRNRKENVFISLMASCPLYQVLFNGKPADLPIHEGDLHMFSRYQDGIGFATNSGVLFFCTPNFKTCAFQIDGFYFGKTRGLLGTYNNEPYDDTTLPSGKVGGFKFYLSLRDVSYFFETIYKQKIGFWVNKIFLSQR